ncbi:MAG: T9SS type A sorting domain-containing protein [Bacteroidota bacterium]
MQSTNSFKSPVNIDADKEKSQFFSTQVLISNPEPGKTIENITRNTWAETTCPNQESSVNSGTKTLVPPDVYNYRSRASGNWTAYTTKWLVSKNGGAYAPVTTLNSLSPYYPTSGNANSVEIMNGHTISANIAQYVPSTTIDNGGILTVPSGANGIGFATGTTLTNNGTLNCNAGGSGYFAWDGYGVILNGGSFVNNNITAISSTGTITMQSAGSTITNNLAGTINNNSGGIFAIDASGSSSSVYGGIYSYANGGTLVTNYGTINNTSPTGYYVYSGGKYYHGGEIILNNLNNYGTINNSMNGNNNANIVIYYNTFINFAGGTINNSGNLNIGGHSVSATCINNGTYNEGWATIVDGGSSLTNNALANFNLSASGSLVFSSGIDYGANNGTITNLGTFAPPWCGISLNAGATSFTNTALIIDNGTIYNMGSFTNTTTSTFNYKANSGSISGNNYLTYKGDAKLIYNGTTPQTTNFYEYPMSVSGSPNYITINNPGGVILNASRTVNYNSTYPATQGAPYMQLLNGGLDLNQKVLTLNSSATNAIIRTSGYILSNNADPTFNGKVQWNIGNTPGAHIYPFGVNATTYIPFTFNLAAGGNTGGYVTVSTYPTGGTTATDVFNSKPNIVANLNGIYMGSSTPANAGYIVRRFWRIEPSDNPITGSAAITFTYGSDANEAPVSGEAPFMIAQKFDIGINSWVYPELPNQTNDISVNTVTVPVVSSFSPWALTQKNNPLPVNLVSFEANCKGGKVDLTWSTATETNNDYFTLERSVDAENWSVIDIIDGNGNSNELINYQYTDEKSLGGLSYYRLRQTDFNGQFEVFSPVSVVCTSEATGDLTIYPNPFSNQLIVQFGETDESKARVRVTDMLGNIVADKEINVNGGSNTYVLDMENTAAGLYNVEFSSGKTLQSRRILKN